MQNYNWDLMTQFVFPEEHGIVEEVVSVDIKPRWQQIETEDCLRLVGIYHITSTVRFNPKELPEYSEGTYIEHLELNENDGYFEYALPLEVNLPKEKVPYGSHPELFVDDINFFIYDGSNCTFKWNVSCAITEPEIEQNGENKEEILNLQSYDDVNDLPLEIPSVEAFAELVQETNSGVGSNGNQENLELEAEDSYDESYSSYIEEKIVKTANVLSQNAEVIEDEELPVSEQLVETDNIYTSRQHVDSYIDQDDFLTDLPESYTLLDLRSNKVSPE
nr:hypothetical protein [Lysinibacillus timonensis]